jgi:hypothetical protein
MALSLDSAKRKKNPEADVYECTTSFSAYAPDGSPFAPKVGHRVAADHFAVKQWPEFFMPAGDPNVGLERHPGARRVVAETPEPATPEPEPKPKQVKAKKQITVDGILLPNGWVTQGRTVIEKDQVIDVTHPAYKNNREHFEKV